jgi:hypothetical protein
MIIVLDRNDRDKDRTGTGIFTHLDKIRTI